MILKLHLLFLTLIFFHVSGMNLQELFPSIRLLIKSLIEFIHFTFSITLQKGTLKIQENKKILITGKVSITIFLIMQISLRID